MCELQLSSMLSLLLVVAARGDLEKTCSVIDANCRSADDTSVHLQTQMKREGVNDALVGIIGSPSDIAPYTRVVGKACADWEKSTYSYDGTPGVYQYDGTTGCNGWSGLTESECWQKCENNENVPHCPVSKRSCVAARYHPFSTWCHLHSSCAQPFIKNTGGDATVLRIKVYTRHNEQMCANWFDATYTYVPNLGCNGWHGLTEDQCWTKCELNENAPNCPGEPTCAAIRYDPSWKWCHLVSSCEEPFLKSTGVIRIKN